MRIPASLLLVVSLAGCGGGNSSQPPPNGPGFTIASGNWMIPLSNTGDLNVPPAAGPFAGGVLSQSGNTVSGIVHVTGSSCFDPIADSLLVQGTVSSNANAANAFTFTTTPVRGQILTVVATWDNNLSPGAPPTSPPNPVQNLIGSWQIIGGACAASSLTGFAVGFHISNFGGSWAAGTGMPALTATLAQTATDAQGFSQLSGTFALRGSSCFTTGSLSSTAFAGDIAQMTVATDTGQLTGSAQAIRGHVAGTTFPSVAFNFTVHGGACDGQTFAATVCDPNTAQFVSCQ